jgi:MYXO-CTERM domain-containing protein
MKTRHVVGLVGAAVLCIAADANAADPTAAVSRAAAVMMAGDGNMGRLDGEMRLRGPGFEQTDVVSLQKDGKQYVVLVTMQSFDQQSGYGPWQCSCSSYELQNNAPPKEVVHLQRLSSYRGNGERLCNHPRMATDGDVIMWGYGSDYNNNRPSTYVGVIDHMCRTLANPVMVDAHSTTELPPNSGITADDNGVPTTTIANNNGAIDIAYNGNGNFTLGYLSTAGNATEAAYAVGLKLTKQDVLYNVTRSWINPIVSPSNIGRPTIKSIDANRSLFCATQGNNRPPEKGVVCAVLDASNGNPVWKNTVAGSYRDATDQMHYFSQPTIAKISDGRFALNTVESNGRGKNTNLKGTNLAHLYVLDYASDAIVMNTQATGIAAHQTHSTICGGSYGPEGRPVTAVISAPPTGIGRAEMVMVDFDATAKTFTWDDDAHKWPITWYGDSGHLANWYGRNPMRQGRDFLRCIGDVPNPGYHTDGGYMKDVASFFVAAVSGRVPGDYKNSLYVTFVPGKADTPSAPQNPAPADDLPLPTNDNGNGNDQPKPNDSSGCACSTPGAGTSSGTMFGSLALLGLAIAAVRRRRS